MEATLSDTETTPTPTPAPTEVSPTPAEADRQDQQTQQNLPSTALPVEPELLHTTDLDEARRAIFNVQPKRESGSFNGVAVELCEPPADVVLSFQQTEGDERKRAVIQMLVNYVVLPATTTQVFSMDDYEALLAMPWNASWKNLQDKILALMGVAPQQEDKS